MIGYNIFPIGFSNYEKSMIETFFRLAGRRAPHWALTSHLAQARVVLFNATSQQDANNVQTMVAAWQKVIMVGASDYGTGWPVLPRPIKLTVILSLLDDLARANWSADQANSMEEVAIRASGHVVVPPTSRAADSNIVTLTSVKINPEVQNQTSKEFKEFESQSEVFNEDVATKPALVPLSEAPSFNFNKPKPKLISNVNAAVDVATSLKIGKVLLVDDSEIALKHMQNRMGHFGYECDLARSGEEALAMVSAQNYRFVFLDVMMVGLDGYQTCKAIKNNKARHGSAPVVVMLTSRGSTIDKIRGAMAGCDAYLTKPLNEKRMASIVTKFDKSSVTQRSTALDQDYKSSSLRKS